MPPTFFRTTLTAVGCLVSGFAWAAGPETATPVDPATHARADELFKAGRVAATAGDNRTACDRFGESERLEPAPGTQLNLGACEEGQGHILAAREHFRLAVAGFRPDDKRRPFAAGRVVELSKRLAHLTVRLAPGLPADTKLTVDGAQLDEKTLAQGIEVDPGKTTVVVAATGRPPRSYDLELGVAQSRDLIAEAGEPATPSAALPPPVSQPPRASSDTAGSGSREMLHTLGFVGAGVGAAGLVTGSIFGILALHEASVVKANCDSSFACKPAGVSAGSSGRTDTVVSTTAFIAGGVLAAAGVYLLVTTWGHPSTPVGPTPLGGSILIAPGFDRSAASVTVLWRF